LQRAGTDSRACERNRSGVVHRAFRRQAAWRPSLGRERGPGTRKHVCAAIPYCQMSRVLVVEDEQHLADGLRFNLEAEGYQVHVTDTGESALEALKSDPRAFDVVVLDVMLPGKDGFSVMSEMRGAGQFVPTLMLTARGHPGDVLKG